VRWWRRDYKGKGHLEQKKAEKGLRDAIAQRKRVDEVVAAARTVARMLDRFAADIESTMRLRRSP
jgi:hypothetical protein